MVPLELWGPEGCVECKVKFDVADVAYPVVSLGKIIVSGFTFSFDDYKCYMHKGNQRVETFRKGRIFVLRMRRRWMESKIQMVASIEKLTAEEMEIDDDKEGAGVARTEPRADEPGDEPSPPRPREVRPSSIRSGAESVRLHNLTHWWVSCSLVQKEHSWMNRERERQFSCWSARTMTICPRQKCVRKLEYDVEMVLRFLSTYESVEIKTDGEPSIVEITRRIQARRDKTTTLTQTSVGGHQEIGAVERAKGIVRAQLRAYYLDVQDRMKVRIIPDTQLFPWMLRHSVWTMMRYQSDQRTNTDSVWENKRLSIRISVGTIWRSGHDKNCRRWQDESRQTGQYLG